VRATDERLLDLCWCRVLNFLMMSLRVIGLLPHLKRGYGLRFETVRCVSELGYEVFGLGALLWR
jgi:hypothetical protein